MFLHVGNDVLLEYNKIIGIFDWPDSEVARSISRGELFADKQRYFISGQEIKSCILTDDGLYLSNISSVTLKKRANNFLQI